MPVAARNNAFGAFQNRDDHITTYVRTTNEGVVVKDEWGGSVPVHWCSRIDKTSNPKVALTPDGPKIWRKPSSYGRNVCDVTYSKYKRSAILPAPWASIVQEGYPNIEGAEFAHFAVGSIFNGESYVLTDYNTQNRVTTECLLKLADTKVQLGQYYAEVLRSAEDVANLLTGLLQAYRAAKRGNIDLLNSLLRGRKGLTRNWAEKYLQLNFGLMPLVSDLYDSYEFLKESLADSSPPLLVGASRNISDYQSKHGQRIGQFEVDGEAERTHGMKLVGKVSDEFKRGASRIGVANPASIAWELLPYSFVLDWCIPIGSVLEALTATQGLDFVGGYRFVRGEGETRSVMAPDFIWNYESIGSVSSKHFSYRREALSDWPIPLPYVKSPFSTSHILTAVALLRTTMFHR